MRLSGFRETGDSRFIGARRIIVYRTENLSAIVACLGLHLDSGYTSGCFNGSRLMIFNIPSRKKPGLVSRHIDAPQKDALIDRPRVEIKGWVAFDQPIPESELRITVQDVEQSVVLSIEPRDDVSSAFPDLYCRGFCQLVDLGEFSPAPSTLTLKIEYPGGVDEIELSLKFIDAISNKSSYFKLNPNEHSDHAAPGMKQEQKDFWDENGYLVIPGFYSAEQVSDINAHIELLWQHRKELNCPVTVDEYIGTDRKKRSLFNQVSESIREQPYKINDLYLASAEIRDLVLNPEIAQMLSALMYAGDPMICSSLYFEKGSQQEKHFDTFFMAPLIRDRMLATWIALEDVTEENGPLFYYPGSHRIAPYRFENGRFNLNPSEKSDCYEYIDAELEKGNQMGVFPGRKRRSLYMACSAIARRCIYTRF